MADKTKRIIENTQKKHFDTIAHTYEESYDDIYSSKYREQFIYKPIFNTIELNKKRVLEAMCGSGQTTGYLLSKGAEVTGLDISSKLVNSFKKRWPQVEVSEESIFKTHFQDEYFDVVVIIGGLHHLHPHVDDAIHEIWRILKKDGFFCFAEPYNSSLVNIVRRIWYTYDSLFEKNEGPIDLDMLKQKFLKKFSYRKTKYIGGIAFLFVLNSMIFRIPFYIKKYYADFIIFLEKFFSFIHRKKTSCLSLNIWQKK